VSAFAPICNPVNCAWGQKAFGGYLNSPEEYPAWDASLLAKNAKAADWPTPISILIDQGEADSFLPQKQLNPDAFQAAVNENAEVKFPLELRLQPNYDHSYYFIATFIEEHLNHHHKFLYQ
jgi:S-formylglutathione hydrolase